jgi:hypothetical protein
MMSSQIQPAAPDAGEPTAIVADEKATALAALAWSADDDDDETIQFDDVDDRTTFWLRLYVAILAAVVVISGVVLWLVLSDRHQPAEPAPVPVSSAPVAPAPVPSGPDDRIVPSAVAPSSPRAAAPVPMPPSVTQTPAPPPIAAAPPPMPTSTPVPTTVYMPVPAVPPRSGTDEAFLAALREDGIIITDPAEIIAGGHRACEYIAAGHTAHDTMRLAMAENSTLTLENASTLIGAAIGAYCPQYTGM